MDASDRPRGKHKGERQDVRGWVVLDRPVGMTSTPAVWVIRRLFQAKRAGHAGTLDPLASGCLPVALGEATKTVPFVMDGQKTYLFTVRWGEERDTDDAEGRVVATSDERPGVDAIQAALPGFIGTIAQVPPRYSAIKIAGERADDLARVGEAVEPVHRGDAARLQRGQAVLMRGRDAPVFSGTLYITASGQLIALAEVDGGEIVPKRVFNLAGLQGRAGRQEGI